MVSFIRAIVTAAMHILTSALKKGVESLHTVPLHYRVKSKMHTDPTVKTPKIYVVCLLCGDVHMKYGKFQPTIAAVPRE